jgi:hypothetical protein
MGHAQYDQQHLAIGARFGLWGLPVAVAHQLHEQDQTLLEMQRQNGLSLDWSACTSPSKQHP